MIFKYLLTIKHFVSIFLIVKFFKIKAEFGMIGRSWRAPPVLP
jgi:hypothetical protein